MDIFEMYRRDPGVVYELTYNQLLELMGEFGEDDCIVDAILVLGDASNEERAEQLGCSPEDFEYQCWR